MIENSDAIQAAHVVDVAASAAHALTETAAHTAAAVVEVAAEAHANLAPSALVLTMFETIQRQIGQVTERLDQGMQWQIGATATLTTLTQTSGSLNDRVGIQNGGVKEALGWIHAHDKQHELEEKAAQVRARVAAERQAWWGRITKALDHGIVKAGLYGIVVLFGYALAHVDLVRW